MQLVGPGGVRGLRCRIGDDHDRLRALRDGGGEGGDEAKQVASSLIVEACHVDDDFVEEDEDRAGRKGFGNLARRWRHLGVVNVAEGCEGGGSAEAVEEFAPEAARDGAIRVGGEGGVAGLAAVDADHGDAIGAPGGGKDVGTDGGVGDVPCEVVEGDEGVGLAAAKAGRESENAARLVACEAVEDGRGNELEVDGRMGVIEEGVGVGVDGRAGAIDDVAEVGGEDGIVEVGGEYLRPGLGTRLHTHARAPSVMERWAIAKRERAAGRCSSREGLQTRSRATT